MVIAMKLTSDLMRLKKLSISLFEADFLLLKKLIDVGEGRGYSRVLRKLIRNRVVELGLGEDEIVTQLEIFDGRTSSKDEEK